MRTAEFETRKYPPHEPMTVDLDRIIAVRKVDFDTTVITMVGGPIDTTWSGTLIFTVIEPYEKVLEAWTGMKP